MTALSKPREVALRVLAEVEKNGAYLNIALEKELCSAGMEARDNALCSRLCLGVMRNRGFIDNIIKGLSAVKLKKLSVWIINILRIGIYSIKFTDKIPVGATVNECVRLARRYGHASSAGYVNAVLRRVADCGDFLDGLEGTKLLSVKYSVPLWLAEQWKREQPDCEALLAAMNEEPLTICRRNCENAPSGFKPLPITPYALAYVEKGSVTACEAYKNGLVAVQDCASQLCVLALDIKKGVKLLDLCAAPGGKAAFAAYLGAEVTACDIYEHKLRLIDSGAARLGVNINSMLNDASVFRQEFEGKFDRVLADVPCSGLGIIRRKPDIKWRKTEADGSALAQLQQAALENAAKYVKLGGRLIYSTCTISRAENEDMAKWFLAKHEGFAPAPLGISVAEKESLVQLRPDIHGTDGFFIAAFERIK